MFRALGNDNRLELQVLFIYFIACDRTSENLFTDNSDFKKYPTILTILVYSFMSYIRFHNHKRDIKSQHHTHKKIPLTTILSHHCSHLEIFEVPLAFLIS